MVFFFLSLFVLYIIGGFKFTYIFCLEMVGKETNFEKYFEFSDIKTKITFAEVDLMNLLLGSTEQTFCVNLYDSQFLRQR